MNIVSALLKEGNKKRLNFIRSFQTIVANKQR